MRVCGEARERVGAEERLADGLRGPHAAHDDPRLVDVENRVAIEKRGDVGEASQREQTFSQEEAHHLREIGLGRFALGERSQRPAASDVRFAERALRLHRDQREDAVELELLEGEGAHSLARRGSYARYSGSCAAARKTKRTHVSVSPSVSCNCLRLSNLYDGLRRVSATLSSAQRSLFSYASCSAFRNAAVSSTRRGFLTSRISV